MALEERQFDLIEQRKINKALYEKDANMLITYIAKYFIQNDLAVDREVVNKIPIKTRVE